MFTKKDTQSHGGKVGGRVASKVDSPIKAKRSVLKCKTIIVKKSPEKKEKSSSDNSNHYRFFTYGTKEGVSIAKVKMPILEHREPYLWPFFNFLMADDDYKKHLCVDSVVPLRSPDDPDEPLANGRNEEPHDENPYGYHWYCMIYLHTEAKNNTVEWRKNWGTNLVHMINNHVVCSQKFQYPMVVQYRGDQSPISPHEAVCNDYLPTGEVLKVMQQLYNEVAIETMLKDDEFLKEFFGANGLDRVRLFWAKANPVYPGMSNELQEIGEDAVKRTFNEELKKLKPL